MAASRYAERTDVPSERTRTEIEHLLQKFGAEQFLTGWADGVATVAFQLRGRYVRLTLPLPSQGEFARTEARGVARTPAAQRNAWEQACRQRWRALLLVIRAKLEAVEAGITTLEREFLPDVLLPDGATVGDWLAPQLAETYRTGRMPALLPGLPALPALPEVD